MAQDDTSTTQKTSKNATRHTRRHVRRWRTTRAWLTIVGIGTALVWFVGMAVCAPKIGAEIGTEIATPMPREAHWANRAAHLLTHPASFFVWTPLVACAVAGLVRFVGRPGACRRSLRMRMAIYAGFSIVLYYWLLLATTVAFEQNNLWAWFLMNLGAFALGTLLWLLLAARYAVTQEWRDRLGRVYRVGLVSCSFLGVSLLLLSLATLIVGTPPTWIESTTSMLLMIILTVVLVPPLLFLWGFIVCTPTLALIAYGGVSVYLFYYAWKDAKGQFSLGRIFIVTAWLAALLSLWRVTVMWAFGG